MAEANVPCYVGQLDPNVGGDHPDLVTYTQEVIQQCRSLLEIPMPLSNLTRSAADTYRYCDNKTGVLTRDHPDYRRTFNAGRD